MKRLTIAIDGPAAAGKSSLAKLAADRLGYSYLESGVLYRTLTYEALCRKINFTDEKALIELASQVKLEIKKIDGKWHIFINGKDTREKIKTPAVEENVAKIGQIKGVREKFLTLQRKMVKQGGIVVEGRDIGTVVLPKADKKFYIDASVETRAQRKCKELQEKGYQVDFPKVLNEIKERDLADMGRQVSPLKKAADALQIDTTRLTIEEGVEIVLREVEKKQKRWMLYAFLHCAGRLLFKLLFRLEVKGKENIPKVGPVIITSNHLSLLDPPIIGTASPRRLSYMALDQVFKYFLIGNLSRRMGAFPVKKRGVNVDATKTSLEILQDREAVLIFIEGTRSPDGTLLDPKPGVGMLAYKSLAPIVPTLISGSGRALPRESKLIRPRKIKVSFGKALDSERFSHLEPKEAYKAISNETMNRIKKMQKEISINSRLT
jgi:cytidylate kinase